MKAERSFSRKSIITNIGILCRRDFRQENRSWWVILICTGVTPWKSVERLRIYQVQVDQMLLVHAWASKVALWDTVDRGILAAEGISPSYMEYLYKTLSRGLGFCGFEFWQWRVVLYSLVSVHRSSRAWWSNCLAQLHLLSAWSPLLERTVTTWAIQKVEFARNTDVWLFVFIPRWDWEQN